MVLDTTTILNAYLIRFEGTKLQMIKGRRKALKPLILLVFELQARSIDHVWKLTPAYYYKRGYYPDPQRGEFLSLLCTIFRDHWSCCRLNHYHTAPLWLICRDAQVGARRDSNSFGMWHTSHPIL